MKVFENFKAEGLDERHRVNIEERNLNPSKTAMARLMDETSFTRKRAVQHLMYIALSSNIYHFSSFIVSKVFDNAFELFMMAFQLNGAHKV